MGYQDSQDLNDFITKLLGNEPKSNLSLPDPDLLHYYRNMENRMIWLDGEVDESLFEIVNQIIYWNQEDKNKNIEECKPIRILFTSPGGALDAEETLVSMIQLSRTPIYGIALGMVASAASLVYLSCHKRYALRNTYFILHRGSCSNLGGSYDEIQAAMKDYRSQIEKMEEFYKKHTLYTEEEIKKNISTDWYIRGEECLEKGLITDWIDDIQIFL